jgi:preprotein translocase subunit SecE
MISKITSFIKEVRLEMKKVNWPSKQETFRYVLIVLATSVVVAAFLGLLDYILIQKVFIKII